MKDYTASQCDFICWTLRQADWERSKRRALINSLFNGTPPYTKKEQEDSKIKINVNDLSGPRAAHDARAQYTSAFCKPGAYFNCRTDSGRRDKREGYGRTVTSEIAKKMKRSLSYTETQRSKWAQTVLHGISPCIFRDADCWRPKVIGIEDVLVPSNTELMQIAEGDLTTCPIYRSFNGTELIKLTRGPNPDPAWNKSMVDSCLEWLSQETLQVAGTNWQNVWAPEKWEEMLKGNGVIFSTDSIPTINVWDFYFWNDEKDVQGWNRRMILDSWTMPDFSGNRTRRNEKPFQKTDEFLYDSGSRKWCSKREELINWQFADLSAVAPFRYHTVRSLGYLLYSVCHLQNRLRCKFNEAVFEQLMVLMRVKSQDDMQRALSVNLIDRGFVDDSIQFIPASERYQVNAQLATAGLYENQNLISRNASTYSGKPPSGGAESKVPTATQWMGEEQRVTQLVSAGLMQAYEYQKPEYYEIFRRFTKKGSNDPDAREVQANCLRAGVPEKVLYNRQAWDIEPERVLGAGNKTLEMMVSQQLMQYRHLYDPDSQRIILHDATLAITDNAAKAEQLVPPQPQISNSIHDAQLSVGTLLMGQPMAFRNNVNHGEYANALVESLEIEIQKINNSGGVTSQEHILGLQNLAGVTIEGQPLPTNGAQPHIEAFSMDPESKSETKSLNERLSNAMNQVRAFQERLQQQQQEQNGNGQVDAESLAKIQISQLQAESKMENQRQSNAQKMAQRQVSFEQDQQRKNVEVIGELERENARLKQELSAKAIENVMEIEKQKKLAESTPASKPQA